MKTTVTPAGSYNDNYIQLIFKFLQKTQDIGDKVDVINIYLGQLPDSLGSHITWGCSGGRFHCYNVGINYTLTINQNSILIEFGSTYLTGNGDCIEPQNADEPSAYAMVNFGSLKNGQYDIEVRNGGNRKSFGRLYLTDSEINFDMSSENGITFGNFPHKLLRIPVDAIWGEIRNYGSQDSLITSFLDTLTKIGAVPYLLPAGNYSAFQIDSLHRVYLNLSISDSTFIRKFNGDISLVVSIMDYYCSLSYNPYELYTGRNLSHSCN